MPDLRWKLLFRGYKGISRLLKNKKSSYFAPFFLNEIQNIYITRMHKYTQLTTECFLKYSVLDITLLLFQAKIPRLWYIIHFWEKFQFGKWHECKKFMIEKPTFLLESWKRKKMSLITIVLYSSIFTVYFSEK